jgi:hypothetical protein
MWWISQKGAWPPRAAQPAASRPLSERLHPENPGVARWGAIAEPDHTWSWHDGALPDHVRRTMRPR